MQVDDAANHLEEAAVEPFVVENSNFVRFCTRCFKFLKCYLPPFPGPKFCATLSSPLTFPG